MRCEMSPLDSNHPSDAESLVANGRAGHDAMHPPNGLQGERQARLVAGKGRSSDAGG